MILEVLVLAAAWQVLLLKDEEESVVQAEGPQLGVQQVGLLQVLKTDAG
jgi:hypothetical protein